MKEAMKEERRERREREERDGPGGCAGGAESGEHGVARAVEVVQLEAGGAARGGLEVFFAALRDHGARGRGGGAGRGYE